MDVAKVKAVLLDAVGNPQSGVIADYADVLSEAVVKAFTEKKAIVDADKKAITESQNRELRIVKPDEQR